MKLQKLILLFTAVIAFNFSGLAQVEPGEAPMFGNVRSLKPMYQHDFGQIKDAVQTYSFVIKNTGDMVIDIVDIKVPAKISINVMQFHINPGEEGTIIVTCDPKYMEEGDFYTWFILTTEEKDSDKIKTEKIKFYMKGNVVK